MKCNAAQAVGKGVVRHEDDIKPHRRQVCLLVVGLDEMKKNSHSPRRPADRPEMRVPGLKLLAQDGVDFCVCRWELWGI